MTELPSPPRAKAAAAEFIGQPGSKVYHFVGTWPASSSVWRGPTWEQAETGGRSMPTNESLGNILMKDCESKSLAEIVKGPPSVLQGLSEGDAQKLKEAFGIDTVEELAKNRFFLWAQALVTLAAQEK